MTGAIQALETAAGVASNLPVRDRTQTGGWKPYPAYKDSGVEWLGRVPEHWDCLPHRAMFEEVLDRGHPDAPMLSVTIGRGVIPQSTLLADSSKKDSSNADKSKYKLVRPGDLAYNKMRAWQGAVGVSSHTGIISPAYVVVRPRRPQNTRFYHYLFRTPSFATEAERWSYGITSDQWSLRAEDFKRIYSVIPPPSEQDAIVRFLDYHDRLIRKYIRAKQKLIVLLTEQKQAIIQHAVTRGLNPDAKFKPSGLDWLGDIPVGWKVRRLRTFIDRVTSGSRGWSNYAADAGPLFLRITNLSRMSLEIDLHDQLRLDLSPEALREGKRTRVQSGDLLLSITAYIGSVAIVPDDFEEAYVSQHVACCRLRPGVANPRWLGYVLLSPIGQTHGSLCMYGGTKQGLSLDDVKNYVLLLPPRHEQDELVKAIESEAESVDTAITRTERQIALMREYRTRLTADVVTGKIDVREAATGLPDLPPDEMHMDAGLTEEDAEEMEA